jgi:hypothetical protein
LLRLRCGDRGHDKLGAFFCRRCGFCPPCAAPRLAQTAAQLAGHVIRHGRVRQGVLSLPIPLRLLLAAQPKLVTLVFQAVQRVVPGHALDQAGLDANAADGCVATVALSL